MQFYSIRGAITIDENTKESIVKGTEELLQEIIIQNDLNSKEIINILFTATKDLNKSYPGVAVRNIGFYDVPIICLQEMFVENSLEKCIRIMINISTSESKKVFNHVYLKGAKLLRLDLFLKNNNIAITIDGPAGCGKSSVSKLIAKELNINYIDTGAMYRAIAFFLLKNNINFNSSYDIIKNIEKLNLVLKFNKGIQQIFINNEEITNEIRTEEIGKLASIIARLPEVRNKLTNIQREVSKNKTVIMDGRDIGTSVLPNANVKIYMDADINERVLRRFNELNYLGKSYSKEEIKKEIEKRDFEDKNRKISPLKKPKDSIFIDTTNMNINEVKDEIINVIKEKLK